jgi:hypothetical protein
MISMRRFALSIIAVLVLASSAYAAASGARFPKLRYGIGNEPTAGGGTVKGAPYSTKAAIMAWSQRQRTLTLYLIRSRDVNCSNLKKVITRPGNLVQALIKARPIARYVGRRIPGQTLQFLTYSRNPDAPVKAAGLTQGVRLVLTRVNSYPRGVWHGTLNVPTKVYGDKKVYGYNGSFAARWCELRR